MKTLVGMKFGSHLYGTSTPASDLDFKSVFVPDATDILLQRAPSTLNNKRPKGFGEKNQAGDIDEEAFALHKYLKLLGEGQTVALDMLFAPESAFLCEPDPVWRRIYDNRLELVSKSASSFVGYCRTQANKYGIKGSRVHAVREIVAWFDRAIEEHGHLTRLGDAANTLAPFIMTQELEHTAIIDIPQASRPVPVRHLECCNRKAPYTATLKDARSVFKRVLDEYGERALMAEKNEGVDWKALSHAVRVGHEAIELFTTGKITFPLVNADHILAIKQGRLGYAVVAEEIENLLEQVEMVSKSSTVFGDDINVSLRDNIIADVYRESVLESAH